MSGSQHERADAGEDQVEAPARRARRRRRTRRPRRSRRRRRLAAASAGPPRRAGAEKSSPVIRAPEPGQRHGVGADVALQVHAAQPLRRRRAAAGRSAPRRERYAGSSRNRSDGVVRRRGVGRRPLVPVGPVEGAVVVVHGQTLEAGGRDDHRDPLPRRHHRVRRRDRRRAGTPRRRGAAGRRTGPRPDRLDLTLDGSDPGRASSERSSPGSCSSPRWPSHRSGLAHGDVCSSRVDVDAGWGVEDHPGVLGVDAAGAAVVDEEAEAVGGQPDVAALRRLSGAVAGVGLPAVVSPTQGPELWVPVWPGGPVSS